MIYTIGRTEFYEQGFTEFSSRPTEFKKMGKRDDYQGGSVWKTYTEASTYLIKNKIKEFSVYGVLAKWENTEPNGEFNNLILDSQLVKITHVVNKYHKLPYDVHIGRGSPFGNPFTHIEGTTALYRAATREEAVLEYYKWVIGQENILKQLQELKGKVLCCYCHPALCHGHVIQEILDNNLLGGSDMIRYMIEFHNVPAEIGLYLHELKDFGEVAHYSERFPTVVWLDSYWDKDILEGSYGVKSVREPIYRFKGEE